MPTTTTEALQTEPKGYELMRPFLAQSGRAIDKVLGDGNCLFRALAKQLSGSADKHIELRRMIINFEANNAHIFAQLCQTINCTSLSEHVETRRKVFTWEQHWKSWLRHHFLELTSLRPLTLSHLEK